MADMIAPFKVAGPAIAITGSNAATISGTLINMVGDWTLRAFNRSATQDAYLAYGPTSASVATAVVPVIGSPGPAAGNVGVVPVPHATTQSFTFSGPTFFACIVAAGNATLDLTPGEGT